MAGFDQPVEMRPRSAAAEPKGCRLAGQQFSQCIQARASARAVQHFCGDQAA